VYKLEGRSTGADTQVEGQASYSESTRSHPDAEGPKTTTTTARLSTQLNGIALSVCDIVT
jgi:hypothetical protein